MALSAPSLLSFVLLFTAGVAAPFIVPSVHKDAAIGQAEQAIAAQNFKDQEPVFEDVSVSVRRAFPSDVQHEWILKDGTGDFACPSNITHTTWDRLPSEAIGINHNTIVQDNTRCESNDSERRLEFYESQDYDAELNPSRTGAPPIPELLKLMLTTHGPNINAFFDLNAFGEEFLFGYESVIRVCGTNTAWQPGSTAFIARPFKAPFSITGVNITFTPGNKYMVMIPRYEEAVCLYAVETEPDPTSEPVVTQSTIPSEGPSPVDPTIEPLPSMEPDITPEASPLSTESGEDESESACFPGSAKVQLEGGAQIALSDLAVGDRVLVGANEFSTVHGFTHRDPAARAPFVQLTLDCGARLRASAGHFLPTADGRTVAAADLTIGDRLLRGADGAPSRIVQKAVVRDVGLFNPHTAAGHVVVNGVVATTYTTTVQPAVAHAALTPLRAMFAACGIDPLPRLLAAVGLSRLLV